MPAVYRFLRTTLLFSTLLVSSAVKADTFPANAQGEWANYFPGQPFIIDPEKNLEKLFFVPEERCTPILKEIVAQTIHYGRDGFKSKKSATKKDAEEIFEKLHALESAHDPCFESAARAYLATSVHLLDPVNSNMGGKINDDRMADHPMPSGLNLTLLAAAILNQKQSDGSFVVQFLTADLRASMPTKIWNQKTDVGKSYLVSGGYDCVSRGIMIDPYLRPLNLAASFVHELDHLFRDRLSEFVDTWKKDTSELSLPLKITLDETLASVTAAATQRHMRWFHDFKPPYVPLFGTVYHEPLPFLLNEDLTLFRDDQQGPINRIWNLLQGKRLGKLYSLPEINATAGLFLYESFLRGDASQSSRRIVTAPLDEVHEIYQTIHRGYFNQQLLSDADLQLLDPALHGISNDPLTAVLDHFRVDRAMDNQPEYFQVFLRRDSRWIQELKASEIEGMAKTDPNALIHIAYSFDVLFAGFDLIFPKLFSGNTNSPYCSLYLDGLARGALNDYVGKKFKLGETGVKPGETGVKPGETGVKPGETGVKPGETGVKPSLFKPCLDIGNDL